MTQPDHSSDPVFHRNLKRTYPVVERAEGIYLYDEDGKRYIDAAGGALVVSIGYGVPEVIEAMTGQARAAAFAHGSQFTTRAVQELAGRIAGMTPGDLDRVYFVSGGSEATETAAKLARQVHLESGRPGKYKVISRWLSYHGATLGAVAMSGVRARREPFLPMLADTPHIPPAYCLRCPFGKTLPSCGLACAEALEEAIVAEGPETVAAFIAEPVVGAALGAVAAPEGYYRRIREICDKHQVLWIADEVMTGVGRTGRNFGVELQGEVPDLMALAKGLSSGYAPMGAVVAREPVYRAIAGGSGAFMHGHTYGQHPVSCAVANAVLEYIARNDLVQRSAELGSVFREKLATLRNLNSVADIRGVGAMWGVEFCQDAKFLTPYAPGFGFARRLGEEAFARGLIVYPGTGSAGEAGGDHVLLGPQFITTEAQADEIVNLLAESIRAVEQTAENT